MGRTAHDVVVRLGELAAALILVMAFVLWRLMQGPVELDRLVPYVQQAFDRAGLPWHVGISGVRFALDQQTHQLDLWVRDVRLTLPDGERLANFPEMATSFSLGSLLRGTLAPTRVIVEHPMLRLTRDESGAIKFRFGEADSDAPEFGPEVLDQLTGAPRPGTQLGLLHRVMIRDATVILDDRRSGRRWQADHIDAAVERDADGIAGDFSVALAVAGNQTPELHANYRYMPGAHQLDLDIAVDGLEPAALAALSPQFEFLSIAHFPVSGTLTTRLDLAAAKPLGARLDLGFGKGAVQNEQLPNGTIELEAGELHAVYAPEIGQVQLAKLAFDLGGGSRVTFDGRLDGLTPEMLSGALPLPAELAGTLGIVLSAVPIAKFESLWPRALSRNGRRWVLANVHEGSLDEAAVQLDLKVDPAMPDADVVAVHGNMRYHDLTIDYLKGLPPARKVSGTATLTDRRLDFTPDGGSVRTVQVTGGSLQITDLGAPVEWLTIDLALTGPLQDYLEAIDAKPLHYAHEIGVDPAAIGGRAETALHFKLPLLDKLKFDAVEYGAKVKLTGASVAKVALGRALTDGNFTLDIGRPGVHLEGDGRFDGVPSTLDARIFFNPKEGPRARYRVGLTLDEDERRRLDWDFLPGRLAGPVGLDLTYSVFAGARAEAAVALDLRNATLSFDEAGWKKPPQTPAKATLVVDLENDKVVAVPAIEVKAAGLDGVFAIVLGADRQTLERVDVRHLAVGGDDVHGAISRRPEGGWRVEIRGPHLDLSQMIKNVGKEEPSAAAAPLVIDAQIADVLFGPGRELRYASAQLLRRGAHWESARVDAQYPNGHKVTLRFGPESGQRLLFLSDDLGATAKLLDITDNIVGGKVTIRGIVSEDAGQRVFRGQVEGENYTLVRAPGFARVLSLASLSGLGSLLSGGAGIPFTSLRADLAYGDDRLVIGRLLAYGSGIGLTANGTVDLARDQLDIQGTLAPAYTLNSILGNLPGIGTLLLGGEGQALFAADFHLTGPGADPKVSVNPLSALAPGVLRRLFQPNFGLPPSAPAASPAH